MHLLHEPPTLRVHYPPCPSTSSSLSLPPSLTQTCGGDDVFVLVWDYLTIMMIMNRIIVIK